ncbi:MAG: hypothetical protein WB729_01565 [Candidatus Sulfotelmatobacter sp.]
MLWGTIAAGTIVVGGVMENWKKAVIMGSISAGALLFMKRKHAAGVLATGVGLAVLAAEYPEKFENVRKSLPDYFDRSMKVMEMAARAGQRITEAAGKTAYEAWDEIGG